MVTGSRARIAYVLAVAALAAAAEHSEAAETTQRYRAVARTNGAVMLLDAAGKAIYRSSNGSAPIALSRLTTGTGSTWVWDKPPLDFAIWRRSFLFVNGTDRVYRFSPAGRFESALSIPVRATAIEASSSHVWVYSGLPSGDDRRFWRSDDGQQFTPDLLKFEPTDDPRAKTLQLQVTFAATASHLYFAHLVGPPLLHIRSGGRSSRWPLAYSRRRSRDKLVAFVPSVTELNAYSSPAAEIIPTDGGNVAVVRNREDPSSSSTQVWLRRRIDLYDARGNQRATAEFAETIRTVLRITQHDVVALLMNGTVAEVRWGRPQPGQIIE